MLSSSSVPQQRFLRMQYSQDEMHYQAETYEPNKKMTRDTQRCFQRVHHAMHLICTLSTVDSLSHNRRAHIWNNFCKASTPVLTRHARRARVLGAGGVGASRWYGLRHMLQRRQGQALGLAVTSVRADAGRAQRPGATAALTTASPGACMHPAYATSVFLADELGRKCFRICKCT